RILIVDDHEIVREGIRNLMGRARPEWEICGEAKNGKEAVEAVKRLRPDGGIFDVRMPGIGGFEAAPLVGGPGVNSRVLIFTMHESDRLAAEIRSTGAHGYVVKSQAARDLILAVERLLDGDTFFTAVENKSEAKQKGETNTGLNLSQALPSA